MNQSRFPRFSTIGALFLALAAGATAQTTPAPRKVFLMNMAGLDKAKSRLAAGDKTLQPALQKLVQDAEKALTAGPFSVMQKKLVPPSGDKHDYMSLGPYWWPDPAKPDGKPYIRRDGVVNPESRNDDTDRPTMEKMKTNVETLALASYFTDKEACAAHAARLLRIWFLDPATKMNPHLIYGQAIPGRLDGRSIGIIDTRILAALCDAVALLEPSPAWTPDDQRGLVQWFDAYLNWLLTSAHGKDEADEHNNHGTWYDVQVARFALFAGKPEVAQAAVERAKTRLAKHIEPDGRQPHELARTAGFSYSAMNLSGFFDLAAMGEAVGVDLWSYKTDDGRSLRAALDYLAPYADPQQKWPHQQIGGRNYHLALLPLLLRAATAFDAPRYKEMIAKLPPEETAAHSAQLMYCHPLTAAPPAAAQQVRPVLQITPVKPVLFEKRGEIYFVDFGADAFGNLQITFPDAVPVATLTVRVGEKLDANGLIDRKPPGSVNYREVTLTTQTTQRVYQLQIPTKPRHRDKAAVHTPPEIGEITPFRYAEIENSPSVLDALAVRQLFVHTAFDDSASSFRSSDATLNAVWDLCEHTMKATTAFGVYIDGERERIPYEADAYINQLSHLAVDANPEVARHTVEHLLAHPTWPTEWSLHMPMMAAADYEVTGDSALTARNYEALKKKLLMDKAREDGLLRASAIVDWPAAERDGYNDGMADPNQKQQVGPLINTVANAFYFHALQRMAMLARALKNDEDARLFDTKAAQVYQAFNATFFDAARGVYIDGEGSAHASLHANMFALAFDLVPAARQQAVADFVQSRGMACSVYGAQYLLEALYKAGKDDYALQLMTSKGERGWWHMIELGSTMTLEAWDAKFKPNLTWNHAWGAAPANIIARFVLGVRPITPGYEKILIAPRPGSLKWAQAKVPTARGPVLVNFQNETRFVLEVEVPQGISARVSLPVKMGSDTGRPQVLMDKKPIVTTAEENALVIETVGSGRHVFEVQ